MIFLNALIALPLYILFTLFRLVMVLIGYVLVIPQAFLYKYTTEFRNSTVHPDRNFRCWKFGFMFPWGNEEEGIEAGRNYKDCKTIPMQIIYWTCVRNPTNNMRFIPLFSCKIDPARVKWVGNREGEPVVTYDMSHQSFWYFCWQGVYSNFRVQFKMGSRRWRFWVGWKIYPHDSQGLKDTDYRKFGAGFATQFKRIALDENTEYF